MVVELVEYDCYSWDSSIFHPIACKVVSSYICTDKMTGEWDVAVVC